ncbi:ABC transporter permease [Actinokineospora sp.]|uniref:ABC transporter permease n=1 Tax=Actinokineospora sp. TaxID=1872133 RepID=UPI003D6B7CF8
MSVFAQVWAWLTSPENWAANGIPLRLLQHLRYTATAIPIAALIAVPLGAYIGHTRRGGTLVVGLLNSVRALPELGLLVLLVPAMGLLLAFEALTIVLVLIAVPPLLAGTYAGVRNVEPSIVDAARGMGMSEREVLFKVELPNALPLMLGALRAATLQVIATASIAAFVALGGLGRFVIDGNSFREFDQMAGGAVLIAALAITVELVLTGVQWLVVSPGLRPTRTSKRKATT